MDMEKEARVEFAGFREVDESAMNLVNRIVTKQQHKVKILSRGLDSIHLSLKPVHKREKGEIYEIHVKVVDKGKVFASESEDRNLLSAVEAGFERIIKEMEKRNR